MDLTRALDIIRPLHNGVLVTQRANGRPQLSNISFGVGDDGIIRVSITAGRAKAKNLARTPVASLYVGRPDFSGYLVLDADAELSPIAQARDDATVEELIALYRIVQGEHPDWDDYRRAMVDDQRLVVRLRTTHAYGMWL